MANPSTPVSTAATQLNREFVSLWTTALEANLKTAFEFQNAALAGGQAIVESSASLSKDALRRWADVARQAQATTLSTYQASAKLLERE
jgi:hypothetical protein